ncbi:hypothetical protein EI94DRAFT_274459 [Lactarius quietus]|nr:hypothetical protein EI94DRAFT_274459 [Lactarius quietus]
MVVDRDGHRAKVRWRVLVRVPFAAFPILSYGIQLYTSQATSICAHQIASAPSRFYHTIVIEETIIREQRRGCWKYAAGCFVGAPRLQSNLGHGINATTLDTCKLALCPVNWRTVTGRIVTAKYDCATVRLHNAASWAPRLFSDTLRAQLSPH